MLQLEWRHTIRHKTRSVVWSYRRSRCAEDCVGHAIVQGDEGPVSEVAQGLKFMESLSVMVRSRKRRKVKLSRK